MIHLQRAIKGVGSPDRERLRMTEGAVFEVLCRCSAASVFEVVFISTDSHGPDTVRYAF
jgi:hypothetical protein